VAALVAAFTSITRTLDGLRLQQPEVYVMSAAYIMLAMILDGLDGVVARGIGGTSDFGAELDTFVDFTAFGVAPATLIYAISLGSGNPFLYYVIPCLIVISGATRLARFRVMDPLRGQGGFTGLPITINAAWIAFAVFSSATYFSGVDTLLSGGYSLAFFGTILVLIGLQLSTIIYPKIVKNLIVFFALNFLVMLVWLTRAHVGAGLPFILLIGGAGFVALPIAGRVRFRLRRVPFLAADTGDANAAEQDLSGLLVAETSE
jgi:CDP-diacylglycerol--serine O-phosphatidyltransferase